MHYIGVSGHRGAGKSSIAYLIGRTLELICQGHSKLIDNDEYYNSFYSEWCEELMISENCINETNLNYIYFESFSDSIKTFIRLLLGCPEEYLYEDKYKDIIVVNVRDLSCKPLDSFVEPPKLITAQEFYKSMPFEYNETPIALVTNSYMLLREFIMYFGLEVMQRFFGRNVWVKSLKANSSQYDKFYSTGVNYKIFIDLKTPAEATYIKQASGVIINVNRPSHKKGQSGLERLGARHSDKIDYNITVDGDLYSLKDAIREIAKDINDKFNNENNE